MKYYLAAPFYFLAITLAFIAVILHVLFVISIKNLARTLGAIGDWFCK